MHLVIFFLETKSAVKFKLEGLGMRVCMKEDYEEKDVTFLYSQVTEYSNWWLPSC